MEHFSTTTRGSGPLRLRADRCFVTAPVAAQDALAARIDALAPQLDDPLMALTVRFIREHCGIDVPIRPRT